MGTRSAIGIIKNNGQVHGVYCHWDGYPEHNGLILLEHYKTPEKVQELINMGDISSLDKEIGSKHHFNERPDGQCTFYGRDRDEHSPSKTFDTREEFFIHFRDDGNAEWLYLFDTTNNSWYFKHYDTIGAWRQMTEAVIASSNQD